jgi:hypothetical protein
MICYQYSLWFSQSHSYVGITSLHRPIYTDRTESTYRTQCTPHLSKCTLYRNMLFTLRTYKQIRSWSNGHAVAEQQPANWLNV